MIDIHIHILPGADDGAGSMADAVEMARTASECGVTAVIATSHGNLGELTAARYRELFGALEKELKREGIPLLLYPGMEILMNHEALEKLDAGELLTLNGTRYVLVEFDFNEELWLVNDYIQTLLEAGYLPVIAHAERYLFVQRHPEAVYRWVCEGCVIQINKGSLLGYFGRRERETALSLLEHRLAHVAASDAHGVESRTASLRNVSRFLEEQVSPKYRELLLEENPRRLLEGEEILAFQPRPYRRNLY